MTVSIEQGHRIGDLGELPGPVLVFGGPYSNLEATVAMLAEADRLGVPATHVICTGDVVAYCGDPQATVDAIRAAGVHVVMGNCEESLGRGADDCGCGFEEGSACDLLSVQWYAHADAHLSMDARRWMNGLPHRLRFRLKGRQFTVVHGAASSINRFVFASDPATVKLAELALCGGDAVIGGHCGLPFSQVIDGKLWHNAGVIGMPANDGRTEVWYSLLRPAGDGVEIQHRRLAYDHAAAARKMRARGLPAGYADSLETGLWPNLDILPPAETAAAGEPLTLSAVHWLSNRTEAAVS